MAASGEKSGWLDLLQSAEAFTTHFHAGLLYVLHCNQNTKLRRAEAKLLGKLPWSESDAGPDLQVDDDVANRL
jgi:hypothetical protein